MIITDIQKLLDNDLSAFYISQQTGIDAYSIQHIRSGKRFSIFNFFVKLIKAFNKGAKYD
ncbi:DNA-binding protein [Staphylococcus hyicus]|uniref:DNA-binding protein n=1 Tax=Staphylococcus hyicus TaxID=1284 RepID=UPI001601EA4F|nr:DNA-binding protein [Staphylococcus hyicus]MCE5154930.1 DNA-binding protein [Staphylococcus hyicus]